MLLSDDKMLRKTHFNISVPLSYSSCWPLGHRLDSDCCSSPFNISAATAVIANGPLALEFSHILIYLICPCKFAAVEVLQYVLFCDEVLRMNIEVAMPIDMLPMCGHVARVSVPASLVTVVLLLLLQLQNGLHLHRLPVPVEMVHAVVQVGQRLLQLPLLLFPLLALSDEELLAVPRQAVADVVLQAEDLIERERRYCHLTQASIPPSPFP